MEIPQKFIRFKKGISDIELPARFTFPFSYVPHELCKVACQELQQQIKNSSGWDHNFGFDKDQSGKSIGKMFGILIVRCNGDIGYLSAFSGKLANANLFDEFVPPIYDRLVENSFYMVGEAELIKMNKRVSRIVKSQEYKDAKDLLSKINKIIEVDLVEVKKALKLSKSHRKSRRAELGEDISEEEKKALIKQSIDEQFIFKSVKKRVLEELEAQEKRVAVFEDEIALIKKTRKRKSAALQQRLFDQYVFLNAKGEKKSVLPIFKAVDKVPPAGAGDCAAPKLLNYAFENGLEPLAMAEFWWGIAPKGQVRKHGEFYPSCKSKCEPILGHMLEGLDLDPNPIKKRNTSELVIETIFEDDYIVVVSKPSGLLSVPGKTETDSVQTRMKEKYPKATGPLTAHRLDMATSGLMLIAKSEEVYKALQRQFSTGEIKKRYVALLNKEIEKDEGEIKLPLRVDFNNRPQQMVCYEYGKPAETRWRVIERSEGKTRIHFWPITGRTHQLRVHAAHDQGLNAAIYGDVLYGQPAERLNLHAEHIEFVHPVENKVKKIHYETTEF